MQRADCHHPRWLWCPLGIMILCCAALYGQESALAFRGVMIETMSPAGRIENATLVLRGGKVEAVGSGVAIPETARVVEAVGRVITPGWIDPYRVVSIASAGAVPDDTRTVVIRGRRAGIPRRGSITSAAFTRVADSFYPYDTSFRQHQRSGITQLNLVSRGFGQSAIARVTPDKPEAMIEIPEGILFTALTNQTTSLDVVRGGLAAVADAGRPSTAPAAGGPLKRGAGPPTGRRSAASPPGPALQHWQRVREGKSALLVNVGNAATILHLLKLLEPYPDVRVLLVATGANVYRTLDRLQGRKVSLILRPTTDFIPNSRDRVCVPCLAHRAGLEFAISLSLDEDGLTASQDAPLFPVAYLTRAGLPRQIALESLTIRPARMLGIECTHGSIEPGKSANLLIFDGDPLDPGSQLREVLIEGETVYEN